MHLECGQLEILQEFLMQAVLILTYNTYLPILLVEACPLLLIFHSLTGTKVIVPLAPVEHALVLCTVECMLAYHIAAYCVGIGIACCRHWYLWDRSG